MLASRQTSPAQATPCASSSSLADSTELMTKLEQLVSWRTAGMLNEAEFANAKQKLGHVFSPSAEVGALITCVVN